MAFRVPDNALLHSSSSFFLLFFFFFFSFLLLFIIFLFCFLRHHPLFNYHVAIFFFLSPLSSSSSSFDQSMESNGWCRDADVCIMYFCSIFKTRNQFKAISRRLLRGLYYMVGHCILKLFNGLFLTIQFKALSRQ